jgi:hypothetical protein
LGSGVRERVVAVDAVMGGLGLLESEEVGGRLRVDHEAGDDDSGEHLDTVNAKKGGICADISQGHLRQKGEGW